MDQYNCRSGNVAGMDRYGKRLGIVGKLNIGGCVDVVADDGLLYIIGSEKYEDTDTVDLEEGYHSGHLYIADISNPRIPRTTGRLSGLGNTRKLKVRNRIAYIASREDGLFIVDTADHNNIRILSHYDTVEFATDIDICGDLAYIACRSPGVEIVDISDPCRPFHVETIRTGEAQSIFVDNGIIYTGLWSRQEALICDARDLSKPSVTAKMPLDGRTGGIYEKNGKCYIATGQHARGMINDNESDPQYGAGNGLELFDVSDPCDPKFISRIKINRHYNIFNNVWSVFETGGFAFLSHSYNGLFVIDVRDPGSLSFAGHVMLPSDGRGAGHNPVGGVAVSDGVIYVTGICSDLYIVEAPIIAQAGIEGEAGIDRADRVARATRADRTVRIATSPERNISRSDSKGFTCEYEAFGAGGKAGCRISAAGYYTGTQIYSVKLKDRFSIAACGSGGIQVLTQDDKGRLSQIFEYATKGFAMDIKLHGPLAYVAEGNGGLSIWQVLDDGSMETVGYYNAFGNSVRQVVVVGNGAMGKDENINRTENRTEKKYALLQVGSKWLHIVDITDPIFPKLVMADSKEIGLLYFRQIGDGLLAGRYASCFWHASGLYWYDIFGGMQPSYSGYSQQQRLDYGSGLAYSKGHAIFLYKGGYVLLDDIKTDSLDSLPVFYTEGIRLKGKPFIYEDTLFISGRADGEIALVNISEIRKPVLIARLNVRGNPDIAAADGRKAAIPSGYGGLLLFDLGEIKDKCCQIG
ncbi:MAG: hypothetical protein PHG48_00835 [Eubacteriales bacterium]|nr:hypothetical protein [Eubacteriales bacterium]